jgi:biotin carboxyl carrier protein
MLYLTLKYADGKSGYRTVKEREIVLGRDESAQLMLDDRNVSGRHARIFLLNGMYWCEDGVDGQTSKNGTWVNGKRIVEPVPLEKGDTIMIGTCQMTVSEMIAPAFEATEELPVLKGKLTVTPEEFRKLQLAKLEQEIRMQRWKIAFAVALLLFILVVAVILVWPPYSQPVLRVVQIARNPQNPAAAFFSTALPGRNLVFESPLSGKIVKLCAKAGDKIKAGEIVMELQQLSGPIMPVESPITGKIYDFTWQMDQELVQGKPVCRLVDTSSIKLHFKIPEHKFPAEWQEQQKLKVYVQELPENLFVGTILNITFRDEQGLPVFDMWLDIHNGEEKILPGMTATLEGFALPATAIVMQHNQTAVYVVQDNHCHIKKVKVATKQGNAVVIVSGIEENETVIVAPPPNLVPGQALGNMRLVKE